MSKNNTTSLRQKEGCRIAVIGLLVNFILSAGKFMVGVSSNSIAILADSLNNLMDCTSSLIIFIGFRFATRGKDKKHPYGHGRMEYISGFVVSMLIVITAISFGKAALERIIHPQEVNFSLVLLFIPISAIIVKLVLAYYIRYKNKLIQSATLSAASKDSFADALITSMTLLSLIDLPFTDFPLDGLVGLIIAGFVLWTGITSFIENMSLLLGKGMDADLLKEVKKTILTHDVFSGIQTLEIHDYGPESRIAMIQVSLNQRFHFEQVQDIQKEVRVELKEKFDLDATLYWTDHQGKDEHITGKLEQI
ncbi:MAG: cation diffusion facilitator family transporter [Velocimicrobium sp.]